MIKLDDSFTTIDQMKRRTGNDSGIISEHLAISIGLPLFPEERIPGKFFASKSRK